MSAQTAKGLSSIKRSETLVHNKHHHCTSLPNYKQHSAEKQVLRFILFFLTLEQKRTEGVTYLQSNTKDIQSHKIWKLVFTLKCWIIQICEYSKTQHNPPLPQNPSPKAQYTAIEAYKFYIVSFFFVVLIDYSKCHQFTKLFTNTNSNEYHIPHWIIQEYRNLRHRSNKNVSGVSRIKWH